MDGLNKKFKIRKYKIIRYLHTKRRTDPILILILWLKPSMNISCNVIGCWLHHHPINTFTIHKHADSPKTSFETHDTNKQIKLFYFTKLIIFICNSDKIRKTYPTFQLPFMCYTPCALDICQMASNGMYSFIVHHTLSNILE